MASATIEHSRPQVSIYFETTAAVRRAEKDALEELLNKLFALSMSACYWVIISLRTHPAHSPIKARRPPTVCGCTRSSGFRAGRRRTEHAHAPDSRYRRFPEKARHPPARNLSGRRDRAQRSLDNWPAADP